MTAPMFKVAKEFIYSIILGLQTEFFIKVGVVSFAADARLDLPLNFYSTQNVTSNSVRDARINTRFVDRKRVLIYFMG